VPNSLFSSEHEEVVAHPGTCEPPGVAGDRASRVAVAADVHGNAIALAAVAGELTAARPDLVVFLGDLTWGPLPEETWAIVQELEESFAGRIVFVRGNAERALSELRRRPAQPGTSPRERWMLAHHAAATLDALENFDNDMVVDVDGLGRIRFCHGSPRSDEELITPGTPARRMRELMAGVPEQVLVSAHTHIQFDRVVESVVRSVSPGSVGMPYEGEAGAFWAFLGPEVSLRRTEYDLELAIARYRESNDPLAEAMVATLLEPPTPTEVIAHAEALEFSS
jgi:predicted phosphodiesterase